MSEPRIIAWDLETSNLNADFGFIICAGWKVIGDKSTHVISITDFPRFKKDCTNDKDVVRKFSEVLSEADAMVTWYGGRFDEPFLQSRLLTHGLLSLPPIPHMDMWRTARNHLKLHSNRLASVSEFLQLDHKTPVLGGAWVRAMAGHKPSIKYVIDHCSRDVEVLEQAYLKLRPLEPNHISRQVYGLEGCPRCGSTHMQARGFQRSLTRFYRRFQCQDCGGWAQAAQAEKPLLDPAKRLRVR